jgi:2-polyprenyl-3-methyl-5-hydroxy-6-metoxy-1,4-benzoquinol methylase
MDGVPESRTLRDLAPRKLRWSDIVRAPIHDFPIRDEILYQYAPPLSGLRILEVGPGSGFTAFTLLAKADVLALVDYTEANLSDLKQKLGSHENLRFLQFDIGRPGLRAALSQTYDFVFGLDMFEYVSDEAQGMKNLADAISPNGVLFLTFPNFAPPQGDGATWYTQRRELEKSLRGAGFLRWKIHCVALKPYPSLVFTMMHEWPVRLYRRLRKRTGIKRPQSYDETWAFQHRDNLRLLKPILHGYWNVLKVITRLGGPPFESKAAPEDLLGHQLVVVAWRDNLSGHSTTVAPYEATK